MRATLAAAVALCVTVAGSRLVEAQTPDSASARTSTAPTGRFIGRLINSIDSTPVRSADVRLLFVDSSRTIRTRRGGDSLDVFIDSTRSRVGSSDSTGAFAVRRLAAGTYLVNFRRIGFAPREAVLHVDTGAVGGIISMEPTSQLLAKVMITETSVDRVKEKLDRVGYVSRQREGLSAHFIDRAEILKQRRDRLEDLLSAYGIHSGDVVLDRMPLDYEDVRDYPAELVVGIEIYRRNRPTEFNMTRAGPGALQAGGQQMLARPLIVVWTFIP